MVQYHSLLSVGEKNPKIWEVQNNIMPMEGNLVVSIKIQILFDPEIQRPKKFILYLYLNEVYQAYTL